MLNPAKIFKIFGEDETKELLTDWLKDSEEMMNTILLSDQVELKTIHNLSGSSTSIGAIDLGKLLKKYEIEKRVNKDRLKRKYNKTVKVVRKYIEE